MQRRRLNFIYLLVRLVRYLAVIGCLTAIIYPRWYAIRSGERFRLELPLDRSMIYPPPAVPIERQRLATDLLRERDISAAAQFSVRPDVVGILFDLALILVPCGLLTVFLGRLEE